MISIFQKNSPQFSGEDNLDHSHHNDKSSENKFNGNFKKNNKNLGPSSKKSPTGLNEQNHKNSNNEHLPIKDKGKSPATEDQNDTNISNNIGKDISTKIQDEEDQKSKIKIISKIHLMKIFLIIKIFQKKYIEIKKKKFFFLNLNLYFLFFISNSYFNFTI